MRYHSRIILAAFLILAPSVCSAQNAGDPLPANRSVRPILIAVDIFGNSAITNAEIINRIQSVPTEKSALLEYARLVRPISERHALFLRRRVAEDIELRYLNRAVVEEDVSTIRQLYNEFGFHQVRVKADYLVDTARNTAQVRFLIREGQRAVIWGVRFDGIAGIPDDIREQIENVEFLKKDRDLDPNEIDYETRRALDILHNSGYAFASQRRRPQGIVCGPPDCDVFRDSIIIHLDPGKRYRFAETTVRHDKAGGDALVSETLLRDLIYYKRGEWFSLQRVGETRRKLYRLGVFSRVSVDTAGITPSGDSVRMVIVYTTRNLNELENSIDLSIEQRPSELVWLGGLSGRYNRLNLWNRAIRGSVGGRIVARLLGLEELEGGGDVSLEIPRPPFLKVGIEPDLFGVNAAYSRAAEDAEGSASLVSQRWGGGVQVGFTFPTYTLLSGLNFRLSYQNNQYFGVRDYLEAKADALVNQVELADGCDPDSITSDIVTTLARTIYRVQVLQGDAPELAPSDRAREISSLLESTTIAGMSVYGDHRNDYFSPTSGYLAEASLDIGLTGNPAGLSVVGGFVRLEGDARYFFPVGDSNTIGVRGHVGIIGQFGGFPLTPISNRFHTGGPTGVRGWPSRGMLLTTPPGDFTDECAAPVLDAVLIDSRRLLGGLGLLESSIEYRSTTLLSWINESLVLVAFTDFGNAFFQNYSEDAALVNLKTVVENIGWSAGLDIGFETPFGPVRAGYGYRIHDPIDKEMGERWIWERPLALDNGAFHFSIGYAF